MPLRDFLDRHPRIIGQLLQARRHDRVAHAFLFSGDQPALLQGMVTAWLQVCACVSPLADGDACGACPQCQQLATGKYPYLNTVQPRSRLRLILVDQIRQIEHQLFLKSAGELKIGLILDAHRMNVEAQNAFLKTLEEPSPRTLLVLVSSLPGALLPTIVSRCQRISLMENRVDYDWPQRPRLMQVLHQLRRHQGALVAELAAGQLQELLQELKEAAATDAADQFERQKASLPEMDAKIVKALEEERKVNEATAYSSRREQVFSLVHTWFAQEYLRANGVPIGNLPHPDLLVGAPPELLEQPVHPAAARRSLELTETFLRTIELNVAEELAILDYCQRLCQK